MISFKEFLSEVAIKKWDVKKTSLDGIIKLLNAQYKDGLNAIANGSVLYRGFGGGKKEAEGYKIINTTDAVRTSRDTNNLYQLCMDHSSVLAQYPKRSNSMICCTRMSGADSFGTINVIIPIDGTKVAVCASKDMFDTMLASAYYEDNNVESFGDHLKSALTALKFPRQDRYLRIEPIDEFLTNINPSRIAEVFDTNGFNMGLIQKLTNNCAEDKKMTAIASAVMTPKSLDLKLLPYGGVLPTSGDSGSGHALNGNEAWFSGKAVAIDLNTFAGILMEMKKLKMPIGKDVLVDMEYYIKKLQDKIDRDEMAAKAKSNDKF
jgi:hypothetical protein